MIYTLAAWPDNTPLIEAMEELGFTYEESLVDSTNKVPVFSFSYDSNKTVYLQFGWNASAVNNNNSFWYKVYIGAFNTNMLINIAMSCYINGTNAYFIDVAKLKGHGFTLRTGEKNQNNVLSVGSDIITIYENNDGEYEYIFKQGMFDYASSAVNFYRIPNGATALSDATNLANSAGYNTALTNLPNILQIVKAIDYSGSLIDADIWQVIVHPGARFGNQRCEFSLGTARYLICMGPNTGGAMRTGGSYAFRLPDAE